MRFTTLRTLAFPLRGKVCPCLTAVLLLLSSASASVFAEEDAKTVPSRRQLVADGSKDQDDLCFWIDSQAPSRSLVIASDKSANSLFVYDLSGRALQQVSVAKPGNIDIRQNVKLDGRMTDVVVVNQRSEGFKLRIFRVDGETRRLEPLDAGDVLTGPNYGGCLYLSRATGRLSFLCTSDKGTVEQHEIIGNGNRGVTGTRLRAWPLGTCEGAVADDATGTFYIAEERQGIWKVGAEPESETPGELIARIGSDDDLRGDLEGLTIARRSDGNACLIVSDQGGDRFVAFDLKSPHRRMGEFRIHGARKTDGIDVLTVAPSSEFPEGVFGCHTDTGRRAIQLSSWADIRPLLKWD